MQILKYKDIHQTKNKYPNEMSLNIREGAIFLQFI